MSTAEFVSRIYTLLRIKSQVRGRDAFVEVDLFGRTYGTMQELRAALHHLQAEGKIEVIEKSARYLLVRPL
jgi:hypothetical protein